MTRILSALVLLSLVSTTGCNPVVDLDGDGVPLGNDCDDSNLAVNPGEREVCNGIDDNCNGEIDEGFANTDDSDADGIPDCADPIDDRETDTDTDTDSDSDTDTDTDSDDDCAEDEEWYLDADGDGFPKEGTGICNGGDITGYIEYDSTDPDSKDYDCNDLDRTINPGAEEVECDEIDTDCNGLVDDNATDASAWFKDVDGDGYGGSDAVFHCKQPSGLYATNDDCDDDDADIHPDADELCDDIDQDCDGETEDDESTDATELYTDADGDGFGNEFATMETRCDEDAAGFSTDNTDCDDSDGNVNSDAEEVCDGIDNDCDGQEDDADSDVTDQKVWYADSDHDDFGNPDVSIEACEIPRDFVADDNDCNDGAAQAKPGATETCDGIDNDCDGDVDEAGSLNETNWYPDADEDGYGFASNVVSACDRPTTGNYVSEDDTDNFDNDCNDLNETVNPGAPEQCDTIDHDCDGDASGTEQDFFRDSDSDGFGDPTDSLSHCAQPSGFVTDDTDCDDADEDINPDAIEICDSVDNDCDGDVDSDAEDVEWYEDSDGDGFGDPSNSVIECAQPTGRVRDNADCNDATAAVNPDATEICDDSVDNDCNGDVDDDDAECGGDGSTTGSGGTCDDSAGECIIDLACRDVDSTTFEVCMSGPIRSAVVPGSHSGTEADSSTGSLLKLDGDFMDRYYSLFYSYDASSGTFDMWAGVNKPIYTNAGTWYCSDVPRSDWFPRLNGVEGSGDSAVGIEADINLAKAVVTEGADLCEIDTSASGGGTAGYVTYVGP